MPSFQEKVLETGQSITALILSGSVRTCPPLKMYPRKVTEHYYLCLNYNRYHYDNAMNHGIGWTTKNTLDPSLKSGKQKDAFVRCFWRNLRIWTAFISSL
ncbi:hypothetical protein CRENBAI_013095 [Crenichthys baileyi]|uniref:Uncharacterized protein n=1 Tax=Crenichthys baileyi TaxID=28760 RepID=A0AAV9SCD1_9TELE